MTLSTGLRSLSVAALGALWVAGCANQIPPAGGPMDEAGPAIVATWPAPFSVGFTGDRVEFTFDDYIDQRSFEESIFLSPAVGDMEFEWSGTVVEVIFLEPLMDSTTYVLSVGTDVTDLEPSRRNRMRDAFTMAFSTGPTIDRGLLAGRLYARAPSDELSGVMVLAYHLGGIRSDTLNPLTTLPTYATQTGQDGTFRLPHIRLGPYRLLALRDEYRNLLYERETDEFALPAASILLTATDTARTSIVLQMGKEDTTGPRLVNVEVRDRNHLGLSFSEEIDTSAGRSLLVSIIDTLERRAIPAFIVLPDLTDLKRASIVCDYLTPDRPYLIRVDRVFDLTGNPGLSGAIALMATGPANIDTLATRLMSVTPRDSTRDLDPNLAIDLLFSQPILAESAGAVEAVFTADGGTDFPAMTTWVLPTLARITPSRPLQRDTWYTARIAWRALQDWKTAPVADSTFSLRLATRDPENDGSIEGRVEDEDLTDTTGTILIVAREIKTRQARIVTSPASSTGAFRVGGLPAGRFIVHAFRDRNLNGRLDPGIPFPVVPSERRSLDSDTVRVRPRWPLEGLRLRLMR
jgi:hypothetical protein